MKKVAVSGIQITGNVHLGNYLGAIMNWVEIQENYHCLFFLADLHAMTSNISPTELKSFSINTIASCIASGLSSEKIIFFNQSSITQHTELAWIFNCITPIGALKRMTQFKTKINNIEIEDYNLGLLSYPVLMAADILLYMADIVPVGEDQKQHIELTRNIANIFNNKYKSNFFKLPIPLIKSTGSRIMSLDNGNIKMSKSNKSEYSRINIIDSADVINNKLKKAKTDSILGISYDPSNRPEVSNLINIFSKLSGISITEVTSKYHYANFSIFKKDLTELVIGHINPIRNNYNRLMRNKDYLNKILINGISYAREYANSTLVKVKQLIGIL